MPGRRAGGSRSWTNAEKQKFVVEFGLCVDWGAKTALMRRWGLHPSVGRRWVIAAEEGRLGPGAPAGRWEMTNQDRARLVALERENEALRAKVAAAEAALVIMGKAHELLDGTLKSSPDQLDQVPVALMSVAQYQDWLGWYKTT